LLSTKKKRQDTPYTQSKTKLRITCTTPKHELTTLFYVASHTFQQVKTEY